MKLKGRSISGGIADGEVLQISRPISWLGGVDKGKIDGIDIEGKVLVFPVDKGSTVGSYVIYQLKMDGRSPIAVVLERCGEITAVGVVISEIPCIDRVDISLLKNGDRVMVDGDKGEIVLLDK